MRPEPFTLRARIRPERFTLRPVRTGPARSPDAVAGRGRAGRFPVGVRDRGPVWRPAVLPVLPVVLAFP